MNLIMTTLVMMEVKMDGNRLSIGTLIGMAGLVLIQNQACTQENRQDSTTDPAAAAAVSDVLGVVGINVVIVCIRIEELVA